MILVDKHKGEQFIDLLDKTALYTIDKLGEQTKTLTGNEFEDITYDFMTKVSKNTVYEDKIEHTGSLSFPDIVIPEYKQGVEVKVTRSGKWQSLGNSVAENTRIAEIERIYMYFGKVGNGQTEIKYRPYQECLSDILVTHSPRYKIDMELDDGQSIFNKIGVEYDQFRLNNPIKQAKDYYRKQLKPGEDLWWVDGDHEEDQEQGQNLIIKNYSSLSQEEKELFLLEVFILFPEVFASSNPDKYTRIGAFLLQRFGALSSSLRDIFSAGGQVDLSIGGKKSKYPRVLGKLNENSDRIMELISTIPAELFNTYWSKFNHSEDLIKQWFREVDVKAGKDKRKVIEELMKN
ncbi:hypothetical protein GF357_02560 [Candidatus Dojkabacteria bacterium]|nr:hypothetical protein [Candidatus Dojkabacteria bacterium]